MLAQEDISLTITAVNPEEEYVVIKNEGSSAVDLSGYIMEFEYKQNVSQDKTFPSGTTIEAGQSILVASGAVDVDNADVTFDYEGEVINNESDQVAVLTPDGNVVASASVGEVPSEAPEETETETPEATETETPEATETETPEATETETPEATGTETPEATESSESTSTVEEDGC
ncbi:lamin tail domain-containing protein [Halogranum amylolyticum]|uniref:lamin tail domain-containing protein n=1 Tax=Halogranum amylolyticum TaxID=660520 RepID=UPI00147B18AB|nr:lamin tail domain-containing protein [Halogranum amylolyticum]